MNEELEALKFEIQRMENEIREFEEQGKFAEANAIKETLEFMKGMLDAYQN